MLLIILTFTHIPHPMHKVSDIVAILSTGVTSMHSLPIATTSLKRLEVAFNLLTHSNYGAGLLALLTTLLWSASV